MAFTLIWMRGAQPMGSKHFDELAQATGYALDNLHDVQIRFGATAVKVIDELGRPQFLKAISRHG